MEKLLNFKRPLVLLFTEHPFAVFVLLSAGIGFLSFIYAKIFQEANEVFKNLVTHHPTVLFVICPLGLVISFWMVRRFAPAASGSGIPQVVASLELNKIPDAKGAIGLSKLVSKRVLTVKILSSLVANLSGAVIGREGPTIQLCSIFFVQGRSYFKSLRIFSKIRLTNEAAIVTGAAAGLAAAFNTPLGGIMFAIEELSIGSLNDLRTKSILGVFIAGAVAQVFYGSYLFIGHPLDIEVLNFTKILVVFMFAAGMGALGAFAGKMYMAILLWRKRLSCKRQYLATFSVGLVWAVVIFFFGVEFSGSGVEGIKGYLLRNEHALTAHSSIIRYFSPIFFSISGVAGGIFAPSLSAAAEIASYFSSLFSYSQMQPMLILVSMSAFLTGLIHAPLTSFILVFEMTDVRIATFPMLLSVITAYAVARMIGKESFYHAASHSFMNLEDDIKIKTVLPKN